MRKLFAQLSVVSGMLALWMSGSALATFTSPFASAPLVRATLHTLHESILANILTENDSSDYTGVSIRVIGTQAGDNIEAAKDACHEHSRSGRIVEVRLNMPSGAAKVYLLSTPEAPEDLKLCR